MQSNESMKLEQAHYLFISFLPSIMCTSDTDSIVYLPQLLHPRKLTWNLNITQLKRNFIFQTSIFVFHVNFPGCFRFSSQVTSTTPAQDGEAPGKSWPHAWHKAPVPKQSPGAVSYAEIVTRAYHSIWVFPKIMVPPNHPI